MSKKKYVIPVAILLIFLVGSALLFIYFGQILTVMGLSPAVEDVKPEDTVTLSEIMEAGGTVSMAGQEVPLDQSPLFFGGRLYLPALETAEKCGLSLLDQPLDTRKDVLIWQGLAYYSINDFVRFYDLWPVFRPDGVDLYRADMGSQKSAPVTEQAGDEPGAGERGLACLRLEDIMADPRAESKLDHQGLEKLRVMGKWLNQRGQEYSVAWIPLYTNPGEGIQNDLTQNFNYYNADFIYTLDCLAENGGHIGLHGLTHQDRDTVSADGLEFGEDTPFTEKEIRQRMVEAKAMAYALGYRPEFFEFPHYAMTRRQASMAEDYFNVIYQQKTDREPFGRLERSKKGNREILYVPTPADYVHSAYDKEGMAGRLRALPPDQLVSFFFHPPLDFDNIVCTTDESGIRRTAYNDWGILPTLNAVVKDMGLSFGVPWETGK